MTYQKLIIVGFLGGDPDMRFTEQGVPVASFSVATKRTWSQDGQKHDETTWFRVTCWRRTAEIAADYLKKGHQVMIEGRLAPEIRLWQDKQGNDRASYEVTADRLVLLSNRDSGESEPVGDDGEGPPF
jgi:single-strand DNA-binding protein